MSWRISTAVDLTGMFNVNKKAERLWAIRQVVRDLTPDDQQYNKAKNELLPEYETELFIALKAVFNKLYYPLIDDEGETAPAAGDDKVKVYQPLRNRVETFLFPPTGHTTWEQIKDGAASRGHLLWTEPGTLERMREALITAGVWREEAGQIQKPPFEEVPGVVIDYVRDKETGVITTTDIKLVHADRLLVSQDSGEWNAASPDTPLVSSAMIIGLKAVDSKGKNKEGKPYADPGIEAPEGATIRLYAEKTGVTREASIAVPWSKPTEGDGPSIDPDKPATVNARNFKLVTRSETYKFLSTLPMDCRLQMVQAKVTLAATDNTVTLAWDRKTLLQALRVLEAFQFLDKEVTDGEWSLRMDQLHFPSGKVLQQWQVDTGNKLDPGLITQ